MKWLPTILPRNSSSRLFHLILEQKTRQESQSSSTNEFARRPVSLVVTSDSRLFVFHFNSRESTLLYSSSIPDNPDSFCSISIPDNHVSVIRSCETDSIPSTILSRHHQRNQEQMSESWSARHQKFETFTSVVQVELNELNLSKSIRRQRNTCIRQRKFRPVDRFRLLEKRESNPWWRTQGFRQSPSLSEHRAHLYA
jgi:hypothetical protein